MEKESAGDSRAKILIAELPTATVDEVKAASKEADTIARHANANMEAEMRSLSLRARSLRVKVGSRPKSRCEVELIEAA